MATTLTQNLKLRVDSNLTANAKYNLQRIDLLGATFLVDSTNTLNIRSQSDILIDPNSPDLGGSGQGSVTIGDPDRKVSSLTVHADELLLDGAFNLLDQATTGTGKLGLLYNSTTNGAVDPSDHTLTLDVEGADRSLVLGGDLQLLGGNLVLNVSGPSNLLLPTSGTLSTVDGVETLTNKTIDAEQNTLSNISNAEVKAGAGIEYSKLDLTGGIVDADVSASAAISYSKLDLASSVKDSDIDPSAPITYGNLDLSDSITNADVSPTAAIAYSKLELTDGIINTDISSTAAIAGTKVVPQFGAQNIRTSTVLEFDNGTHLTTLAPASSGQTQSIILRLPSDNGAANAILSTDGAGNLSWSSAGSGSVTEVGLSTPSEFIPGPSVTTSGTLSFTKANQASNQVYAGPATGAAAQPTFRALVLADLPTLFPADVQLGDVPNVDATNPANIVQTSSFRFVTDTEKSTWNGKQDALGFTPENAANRGIANGYAPLNASAKIDNTYLDTNIMNYHGTWDADTNTPPLADGMVGADPGDIYVVSVAGTQDLGSGPIEFNIGDWVIYNQSNVWEHVDNTSAVTSVNGAQGAVTVNAINELTGDVTAGPASGSESKAATIAAGAITDSKISASAAIAVSKLAAGTNGYVLQTVAGVPQWTTPPASVSSYKTTWLAADGALKLVNHGLGTRDVIVQVFDNITGETIEIDSAVRSGLSLVTLTASQAPATAWRVLILAL